MASIGICYGVSGVVDSAAVQQYQYLCDQRPVVWWLDLFRNAFRSDDSLNNRLTLERKLPDHAPAPPMTDCCGVCASLLCKCRVRDEP
jgi:hypothetical protein